MKLSKDRISSLCTSLIDRLTAGHYIEHEQDKGAAAIALGQVITHELQAEDRLNEEVEQILKGHQAEFDQGRLDYRKMFHLTKKQLAHDRGVIL